MLPLEPSSALCPQLDGDAAESWRARAVWGGIIVGACVLLALNIINVEAPHNRQTVGLIR